MDEETQEAASAAVKFLKDTVEDENYTYGARLEAAREILKYAILQ